MSDLNSCGNDNLSVVIDDFHCLSTKVNNSILPKNFISDKYNNNLQNYINNYCVSKGNTKLKQDVKYLETPSVTPKHSNYKDSHISEITAESFHQTDDNFIIIHVCDEAKKLNKNFNCPRDLLVKEMKYFAQYLVLDSQQLEEVDISVHCDVEIFDWLMRYVKRSTNLINKSEIPTLESNNVVSILISSDFLKMDSLVQECVAFFHKNMSAILSTPCNMNCINDQLCSKIASKFNHNELELVKDRKDKFKNKLFCNKIEGLFKVNSSQKDLLLFKCSKCNKVMTHEQCYKLNCCSENMRIDLDGKLIYEHQVDKSWDVNSWLISLHEQLKFWNLVYWRIWGTINHLYCSVCNYHFQLLDYSNCMFHSERSQFEKGSAVGVYPCCNQTVLRFDPTEIKTGCCTNDHKVLISNDSEQLIYDDLLRNIDLVKSSCNENFHSNYHINIFALEEKVCLVDHVFLPSTTKKSSVKKSTLKVPIRKPPVLDSEEEDSTDSEEILVAQRVHLNYQQPKQDLSKAQKHRFKTKDSTVFGKYPSKHRWDGNLGTRQNQDMQREDDRMRMNLLSEHLCGRQLANSKQDKLASQREVHGGMFVKLEIAFLNSIKVQHANEKRKNNSDLKDAKNKYNRAK